MADAEAAAARGGKQGCGVHAAALTKSALHGGCHADSVLFDDAGACRGWCLRGMRAGVYVRKCSVFSMHTWSRCVGVLAFAVCAFFFWVFSLISPLIYSLLLCIVSLSLLSC